MAVDKRGRKLPRGIRQRGDKYEGRFMVDGKNHSVTGRTIKEVQQKIVDEKYRIEYGAQVRKNTITVDEWHSQWLELYCQHWKQTTRDNFGFIYKNHVKPVFGNVKLKDLRREDIRSELIKALKVRSPGTVSLIRSVMNNMLTAAVDSSLIPANPMPKTIKLERHDDNKRQALTAQQEQTFLRYARTESKYYNVFYFMLNTGMRIGETVGLHWSDLDEDLSWVHVRRTLQRTSVGRVEQTPKSVAGVRDIPLNEDVRALLHGIERKGDYVFMNDGRNTDPQLVNKDIRYIAGLIRAVEDPDFPDLTSHVFRHTFATRAIEAGMNPQTLKTILGHSSLAITMDLYSHVLPDTKAVEMALLKRYS